MPPSHQTLIQSQLLTQHHLRCPAQEGPATRGACAQRGKVRRMSPPRQASCMSSTSWENLLYAPRPASHMWSTRKGCR